MYTVCAWRTFEMTVSLLDIANNYIVLYRAMQDIESNARLVLVGSLALKTVRSSAAAGRCTFRGSPVSLHCSACLRL